MRNRIGTLVVSNLVVISASAAFAQPQPSATKSVTVQQIEAAWRARQERFGTFRFEWNERYTVTKGAYFRATEDRIDAKSKNPNNLTVPSETTTYDVSFSLIMDGAKIRFNQEFVVGDFVKGVVSEKAAWASAGKGLRRFCHAGDVNPFPVGYIGSQNVVVGQADVDYPILAPLAMQFRPFHPILDWFDDFGTRFQIVPGELTIDGRRCIQLTQSPKTPNDVLISVWVDLERDFTIVRLTLTHQGKLQFRYAFHDFEQVEFGSIPRRWTVDDLNGDGSLRTSNDCALATHSINHPIDPNEFEIAFPAGTRVLDGRDGSQYIIKADGRKRFINQQELRQGATYQDLLNSESGEALLKGSAPKRLWKWIIIANVALLATVAAVLIWRQLRRRNVSI